jgi:hypothetical protein
MGRPTGSLVGAQAGALGAQDTLDLRGGYLPGAFPVRAAIAARTPAAWPVAM